MNELRWEPHTPPGVHRPVRPRTGPSAYRQPVIQRGANNRPSCGVNARNVLSTGLFGARPDCSQPPPPARRRKDPGHREHVARLMIPHTELLPKRPTWSVTDSSSSSVRLKFVGYSAHRRANQLRGTRADASLYGNGPWVGQQRGWSGHLISRNSCRTYPHGSAIP